MGLRLIAMAALALLPPAACFAEGGVTLTVQAARFEMPLRSMQALRDSGVVKQRYDYSCGSAALATLFTYGLGDPVDEPSVLRSILQRLSPEEVATMQKRGLTLAHLQSYAQARGYKAQGFRVRADQVGKISRPVIVFIQPGGYAHFAVLKGVRGDRVYLADPSLGNVRMPLYRFLDMWADEKGQGVVFAVERASGEWPEQAALQITGMPFNEELTNRQLVNVAGPPPQRN